MLPAESGSRSHSPPPTAARISLRTTARRPERLRSSAGRRLSASTSLWSATPGERAMRPWRSICRIRPTPHSAPPTRSGRSWTTMRSRRCRSATPRSRRAIRARPSFGSSRACRRRAASRCRCTMRRPTGLQPLPPTTRRRAARWTSRRARRRRPSPSPSTATRSTRWMRHSPSTCRLRSRRRSLAPTRSAPSATMIRHRRFPWPGVRCRKATQAAGRSRSPLLFRPPADAR